jgi:hypothetical protein
LVQQSRPHPFRVLAERNLSEVLNTAFYLQFGRRDVDRTSAEAALVQDILCYDRVFVLTDQMDAVGRLATIMGWNAFAGAVGDGSLQFVHDRNILAWPQRAGGSGVTPFIALASTPQPGEGAGFTQESHGRLAMHALTGLAPDPKSLKKVCAAIERLTLEFGALEDTTNEGASAFGESLHDQLKTFQAVVAEIAGYPLKPADLIRLRRELRDPKRSPFAGRKGSLKLNVMKLKAATGADLLRPERPLSKKQRGMLDLVLSDRFLAIHARVSPRATLHTEPTVEEILRVRLADIRKAASSEVDIVLKAERVTLPVLATPGTFPYDAILRSRSSKAAAAFRDVVERRDADPEAELLQEYIASLDRNVADRLGTSAVRLLVTSLAGLANPLVGLAAGVADALGCNAILARVDARYYIDKTLRRIAEGTPGKTAERGRRSPPGTD